MKSDTIFKKLLEKNQVSHISYIFSHNPIN